MYSLNEVNLIGNVGKAPEIRTLQTGVKMATFSIATSQRKKDGQRQTEWHNVVVYNPMLIDIIEKYLKKGSHVFVKGSLSTKEYQDQNGNTKTSINIVLHKYTGTLIILDKNSDVDSYDEFDSIPF